MGCTPTLLGLFAVSLDHRQRLVPGGGGNVRVRCACLLGRDDKTNAPGMCGISPRQAPRRLVVGACRTVIPRKSCLDGATDAVAREAPTDATSGVDAAEQRRARC